MPILRCISVPLYPCFNMFQLCKARKGKEVWNFKDEDFEPLRHLWREQPVVSRPQPRSTFPSPQSFYGISGMFQFRLRSNWVRPCTSCVLWLVGYRCYTVTLQFVSVADNLCLWYHPIRMTSHLRVTADSLSPKMSSISDKSQQVIQAEMET